MNRAIRGRWWEACLRRDPAFQEAFVFGVLSTGIYCRPTCPARRPLERNVVFFSAPAVAEREGYRPCRRCHPRSAGQRPPQVLLADRACRFLEGHLEDRMTLGRIARELSVSPFHLQRAFKCALGVSPREYLDVLRIERFKGRVARKPGVTAALFEAGFGSPSRLYERSRARLGMTPGAIGKGGDGMSIAYTLIGCPLGRALLAATPLGLCSVEFGDSDRAQVRQLRARYPRARILRSPQTLRAASRLLRRLLSGKTPDPVLPLDVRATAFQARVWKELASIPLGRTRSYKEMARRIGQPGSARAVARACASNPVALVIPCHRAVASDGGLAGYRWGLGRKKALIEREKEAARAPY